MTIILNGRDGRLLLSKRATKGKLHEACESVLPDREIDNESRSEEMRTLSRYATPSVSRVTMRAVPVAFLSARRLFTYALFAAGGAVPLAGGVTPQRARLDRPRVEAFTLTGPAEVVATITAGCDRCDWGERGREAALLELSVDGVYSQHLALVRGSRPAPYRVLLGGYAAGRHHLELQRDDRRSAAAAGVVFVEAVEFEPVGPDRAEYDWLSQAPVLRARAGTVERFSDFPLVMYAEHDAGTEGPAPYRLQYTVIFSNEDGGTPTDRLMATWGRTTDIEFVLGVGATSRGDGAGLVIQSAGHEWVAFAGRRRGTHPVLWVSTDNNMVADRGADDPIWFAPAPQMIDLTGTSREAVMDRSPWTYAVTAAEMRREGRVDPAAAPGSGRIPDPRQYALVEACADVRAATLAFDVGVRRPDGTVVWRSSDRGDPRFRIARGGCFRGGAIVPSGASREDIAGLRVRAYGRSDASPDPAVTLRAVTRILLPDEDYVPQVTGLTWTGVLEVPPDGRPVTVPVSR